MPFEEIKAETLKWCNEIRRANGQRPLRRLPKGKADAAYIATECPVARAIQMTVGISTYKSADGDWIKLPKTIRRFITLWDAHRMPELTEGDFK
jgi:hypothetical protein